MEYRIIAESNVIFISIAMLATIIFHLFINVMQEKVNRKESFSKELILDCRRIIGNQSL